jgi:G3E family GTPase
MVASAPCLPVFVLAGYLGAGKTTLLNDLLHNTLGVRIGVIVNDFGDIAVDAALVDAAIDTMTTLEGNCLCCVTDAGAIDEMIERLAQPRLQLDAIVVESSGLADPANLARRVSATKVDRARYAGTILVVDAAEHAETLRRHPQIAQDGKVADLVVLNKADLVEPAELEHLREQLSVSSQGAPVLATSFARVDPALLFDPVEHTPPRFGQVTLPFETLSSTAEPHLHHQYDSLSFTTERPLSPAALLDLLYEHPGGLYRLKGHVRLNVTRGPGASKHPLEVQSVGPHVRFARQRAHQVDHTELVLIGPGLDRQLLADRLEACCCETPEPADRTAMITINRYLD